MGIRLEIIHLPVPCLRILRLLASRSLMGLWFCFRDGYYLGPIRFLPCTTCWSGVLAPGNSIVNENVIVILPWRGQGDSRWLQFISLSRSSLSRTHTFSHSVSHFIYLSFSASHFLYLSIYASHFLSLSHSTPPPSHTLFFISVSFSISSLSSCELFTLEIPGYFWVDSRWPLYL